MLTRDRERTPQGAERADGPPDRGVPTWTRIDTVCLTAVTVVAAAIRLFRVTTPSRVVFDEAYYAVQACEYVYGDGSVCHPSGGASMPGVHPPLGTWLIAGGIRLFGFRSGGWRLASLAAGTITVILLFLLARRLVRSTLAATIASGALAFDLLHFVHSRLAMLDVFVALFAVAGFLFAVYDRDREPSGSRRIGDRLWSRRWRLAAGAAAGAAVATKWSGVAYLVALFAFVVVVEVSRRDGGGRRPLSQVLREEGPSVVVAFVAIPAVVYVASYVGRVDGAVLAAPWSEGSWVRAFVDHQTTMLRFHLDLDAVHHYASPAWSWPFLKRPPLYWIEGDGGRYVEILGTGNPVVWWGGFLALGYVATRWLRGHRDRGESVAVLGFAASWLPWLVLGVATPTAFTFYLLPGVPFLCLALGYAAWRLSGSMARAGVPVFAAAAVGLFAYLYPVAAAVPMDQDAWHSRVLFEDCDLGGLRLGGIEHTEGVETPEDLPGPYPEALLRGGPAPEGWCWI